MMLNDEHSISKVFIDVETSKPQPPVTNMLELLMSINQITPKSIVNFIVNSITIALLVQVITI